MEYIFEMWQRVRINDLFQSGEVTSRVPGNGTGSGFYYVTTDGDQQERGPFTADELTPE